MWIENICQMGIFQRVISARECSQFSLAAPASKKWIERKMKDSFNPRLHVHCNFATNVLFFLKELTSLLGKVPEFFKPCYLSTEVFDFFSKLIFWGLIVRQGLTSFMSWKRRWFVLDVESTQFSFFAFIVPFFSELIFSYYTFLLRNRGSFPEAYWYFCSYQGGLCTPNFVSSDIASRTPKSPPPRKPLRKVKKKVIILLVTITLRWPVFFFFSFSHWSLA